MPVREILRAVVFLNRTADKKDFNEVVNCIPEERMKDLEEGLAILQDAGVVNTVQIGRYRAQATSFTDYFDQVDSFFEKISTGLIAQEDRASTSEVDRLSSILSEASKIRDAANFTGFNSIPDINKV